MGYIPLETDVFLGSIPLIIPGGTTESLLLSIAVDSWPWIASLGEHLAMHLGLPLSAHNIVYGNHFKRCGGLVVSELRFSINIDNLFFSIPYTEYI